MSTSRCFHQGMAIAAAISLGASAAHAADPPVPDNTDQLQTIEINAIRQPYRGDTPARELPQDINTISDEVIKDVGATKLDTAFDLVSGIARQNTLGGLWDSFAIRGFAGDENTPSGYLVNGFNAGLGFTGRRDMSNVETIEVLKGPGSALYGRGEPGGTINIITKQPQFVPEGDIEVSAGSFSTYRVAGDYTGPISDAVAFRVNGAYQDADSFRDYVTSKKYTVTPSVLIKFNPETALKYQLEWIKQEAPLDRGVVAVNGVLGLIPNSRFLGEPSDGNVQINALSHELTLEHQFNADWSLLAGGSVRDSSFKGYSSDAELVGSRQLLFTDPSLGLVSREHRYRDYEGTYAAGRTELSGKVAFGSILNHVLLGVDAYSYKSDQVQDRWRPSAGSATYALNIYDPVYGSVAPPMKPSSSTLETDRAEGVYVQDQMDLTKQWKFMVGIRFDTFSENLEDRLGDTTTQQSQTATSPRVGLVYELNSEVSFYSSYSKGFRPNTGSNFYGTPFAPEISQSYEVGTKLQTSDKRLSSTIAAYEGKKTNFLTADPVNSGFSIAGGEAESKGFEVDANGQLTDDLRITVSYAYTNAYVSKALLDVDFSYSVPAGSPLINIPKNSAHVLLIDDIHSDSGLFSVGGSVGYVGKRLGETGYLPEFDLPSYALLNLLGAYAPSNHWKLTAHVDNLANKTYYASSYARAWVAPGDPRTYTLTCEYKF